MNLQISLLTATLLLFTACGGEGGATTYKDTSMSCQPTINTNIFSKMSHENFSIENPINEPKVLLAESVSSPIADTLSFDKKGIYKLFQTEYYWANETVDNFDYSNYTSPQALINDLKNSKDRWSFAITKEDYKNMASQKSGGFGFSCQNVTTGCHVTYVRIDSPADKVGLRRADVITEINGEKATHEKIYKKGEDLEKLVNFTVIRKNSNERCNCSVTPRDYTFKVANEKIIYTPKNEKVGYFRLDSFMGAGNIVTQIDKAFNHFKEENIKKLVIDLRYNGGGSVGVASRLLDKLTNMQEGKEQFTLAWNNNYQKNNERFLFEKSNNALNLEQILFLTTKGTASASELVISAMKPYLSEENIVIIGDRTHGKPVGMSGKSDKIYYYFLINFVVKNSLGFYDYFEGLPVTSGCDIDDDPFHDMGDKNEGMLKAALHYVDTGSCK